MKKIAITTIIINIICLLFVICSCSPSREFASNSFRVTTPDGEFPRLEARHTICRHGKDCFIVTSHGDTIRHPEDRFVFTADSVVRVDYNNYKTVYYYE